MPMDFDFDDSDVSGAIEETEREAKKPASPPSKWRATSEPVTYQVEEPSFDDQMSEVEKRLEVAKYYRLVLDDTIFNDPPNVEVADQVENEIREFVRGRMSQLVGVSEEKKAKVESVFSEEEITALRTIAQPEVISALKALAAKVLKKPAILDVKPRQEPAPKAPAVHKEPSLKKITRPASKPTEPAQPKIVRPPPARPQAQAVKKGKKQEKVFKTVVDESGNEVKMDVTPQAQPVGIKPFPTPTGKAAIEAFSATSARNQAMVAISNLETQLTGKR